LHDPNNQPNKSDTLAPIEIATAYQNFVASSKEAFG